MYKIVANWKMYLTVRQSRELAATLASWWRQKPCPNVQLIICPSALALADVRSQTLDTELQLGVQDLSLSKNLGAFTGQLGAQQALELGARYTLLGHSELRQFYHLTDAMIRQQVEVAISHKLHPIICVGETEQERSSRQTDAVIVQQLHAVLEGLEIPATGVSIAYEPRWAIGTGKPVDPREASRVHQLIQHTLQEFTNAQVSVLYGGSVDSKNAASFLEQTAVHGLLIGSASTKLETVQPLVELVQTNYC